MRERIDAGPPRRLTTAHTMAAAAFAGRGGVAGDPTPFDGAALIDFLAVRAIRRREAHGATGAACVPGWARRSSSAPEGQGVRLRAEVSLASDLDAAVERSRALFDLDADPAAIASTLGADRCSRRWSTAGAPPAGQRRRRARGAGGARPAGSLGAAITLAAASWPSAASRWRARRGRSPTLSRRRRPPSRQDPERLAMPWARRALLGLCDALASGELARAGRRSANGAGQLLALPGIGPWTAEYLAMRALGDRDAFRRATSACGGRSSARRGRAPGGRAPRRALAAVPRHAVPYLWAVLADQVSRRPGETPSGSRRSPGRAKQASSFIRRLG
jgi:AraC family transcriptional regulator of adaptative response / DNA-3-methyladenine glycosylase II